MPVKIEFDKAKAQHFMARLEAGLPLDREWAPGQSWTRPDLLCVAGLCFNAVFEMERGPEQEYLSTLDQDHADAIEQARLQDIDLAVGFYARLIGRIVAEKYDEVFEPIVKALAYSGRRQPIRRIKGFKADSY